MVGIWLMIIISLGIVLIYGKIGLGFWVKLGLGKTRVEYKEVWTMVRVRIGLYCS